MKKTTYVKELERLIEEFGSQLKLAKTLNMCRQNVSIWKRNGWVTLEAALKIEKITKGRYRAVNLSPKARALKSILKNK